MFQHNKNLIEPLCTGFSSLRGRFCIASSVRYICLPGLTRFRTFSGIWEVLDTSLKLLVSISILSTCTRIPKMINSFCNNNHLRKELMRIPFFLSSLLILFILLNFNPIVFSTNTIANLIILRYHFLLELFLSLHIGIPLLIQNLCWKQPKIHKL